MTDAGDDTRRPNASLTVTWLAVLAVTLPALVLSAITSGANTLAIDLETTDAVQRLDGQPWRAIAHLGNALGESTYAVTVAIILLVVAIVRRDPRDTAFLCMLLLLRGAATRLKVVFDSPRPTPDMAEVLETFHGFGFPSGHAVTSATALGGLAFLLGRHVDTPFARWSIGALWLVGMVMTGYARIWVGAHWLTDVVGGSLYGVVFVLIAANVSAVVARWTRKRAHAHAGLATSG